MTPPAAPSVRLALFGVALAAAIGLGAAVGAAAGPVDVGGDDDPEPATTATTVDHGVHP